MLVDENMPSSGDDAGSEARHRRGLEVVLWLCVPAILAVVYVLQVFEQFSVVGCEGVCDLDLVFAARAAYPWEVAGSLVVAILLTLFLALRRKATFWGAVVAIVLILASATVTSVLFQSGLSAMHERNDRINEINDAQ